MLKGENLIKERSSNNVKKYDEAFQHVVAVAGVDRGVYLLRTRCHFTAEY